MGKFSFIQVALPGSEELGEKKHDFLHLYLSFSYFCDFSESDGEVGMMKEVMKQTIDIKKISTQCVFPVYLMILLHFFHFKIEVS